MGLRVCRASFSPLDGNVKRPFLAQRERKLLAFSPSSPFFDLLSTILASLARLAAH
jgi:hypothetical protein